MIKLNFPDPVDYPNGWPDDTGQMWDHDGHGWLARNPTSGGGALPPGGVKNEVLTKNSSSDGDTIWAAFNPGQF